MSSSGDVITIVGGGLAGSEAAWQAARRGCSVRLFEMRPAQTTPAHRTSHLAELVCSNSLGSKLPDRARGVLLREMRELGSLIAAVADEHAVPAGGALAVDREGFAAEVTARLQNNPAVEIVREEVTDIPADGAVILATGPLTSAKLAESISGFIGAEFLHFYDAMAPIVEAESLDREIVFRASRYGRGDVSDGDYLNCPFDRDEYETFIDALTKAARIELREFEREDPRFFEGCLPIEVLAARNPEAPRFGPLTPVGLTDPRVGRRPYAVLQLRQDDAAAGLYSLVGAQTNLRWGEQERVFKLVPGLEKAEFIRYGQMHRNTFVNAPRVLRETLQSKSRDDLFFAGQLAGVEGYLGDAATGLLAGVNAVRLRRGEPMLVLPPETMLGALVRYLASADSNNFQPMKVNFGLMPPLPGKVRGKQARRQAHAERAQAALAEVRGAVLSLSR